MNTNNNETKVDRELFVRLLMKHERSIRAFLRSLLPSIADVDEVMQDVSVVAWRKFEQLDDAENFCRWVCVIARYEVLMYRRKKARDRFVLGSDIERIIADEGLDELELRERQLEALEQCITKLPEDRKKLILHVYKSGQQMKTIAKKVGKTPGALYKILSRARRELYHCIKREMLETNQ